MTRVDENTNKIEMTRGDTLKVLIEIEDGDQTYTPLVGDTVRFYLKHNQMDGKRKEYKDANPLVTKTVPTETMILELVPNDTKALDFGDYVYDLEIEFANGSVDTFVNNAALTIIPEVG